MKKETLPEIQHHMPKVPFFLVGSFSDSRTPRTPSVSLHNLFNLADLQYIFYIYQISKYEAEQEAKKLGAIKYIEISAKQRNSILSLFDTVISFVNKK